MIIVLAYLNSYLGVLSIFLQTLIVIFNLIIFIVSLREKEKIYSIAIKILMKLKRLHTKKLQLESQLESKGIKT